MEEEKIFMNYTGLQSSSSLAPPPNWRSSSGVEGQLEEMNCSSSQFLTINWENSMDHSVPFESAISSFVSSSVSASNAAVPHNSAAIGDLIGRLCGLSHNNRELSPSQMAAASGGGAPSFVGGGGSTNSTDTSSYSTPLNSPPKPDLLMLDHKIRGNSMASNFAPFAADPGFAERAAKFSCLSNSNIGGMIGQLSLLDVENRNISGAPSNQPFEILSQMDGLENKDIPIKDRLDVEMRPNSASGSAPGRKFSRLPIPSTPNDAESSNARVEASAAAAETSSKTANEANARKRKAKGKELLHSSASSKDSQVLNKTDLL